MQFCHNTMPQMSQVLMERAIGMLTAGMSTIAVARELNVHFSTISRLQRRFREFGTTSNQPKFSKTTLEADSGGEINIQFSVNSSDGHSRSQHCNCTLS